MIIMLALTLHSCNSFSAPVSTQSRSAPPSITTSISHPSILLSNPIGIFAGTLVDLKWKQLTSGVAAVPWHGVAVDVPG